MSNYPKLISFALTTFAIALSAQADSKKTKPETVDEVSAQKMGMAHKSGDIIGLNVDNNNGETLGRAMDLAIDLTRGTVVSVIVGTGGLLSNSDYIAIPPNQVGLGASHKALIVNSTREKLKSAPTFNADQWREFYSTNRWTESAKFFDSPDRLASEPANIQRATKVVGMTVKNKQDEKVGSVENLMVDLNNKKIIAVIVSSGGFLGIGDTLSAVPPRLFTWDAENNALQLDTTKEALQQAPHFKQGEWPDFSQAAYVDGVYRAYNLDVNSEYNEKNADANNTARNTTRDRESQSITPLDQGNNPSDLHITQQIRKAIVENKSLSLTAQNVKVITVDGQVTLRGPVRTAEEKRIIGDIASRTVPQGKVENQLEVTQAASSLTEM
ncbi:MAG: PRC-barrel domain-containing protein [Nibricoccus sp.]